ncbi:MAG: PilN domain-containing protein [Acidobacteriota bacterium]
MIKINLVREGRAVRGAGASPGVSAAAAAGPSNVNNILVAGGLILGILVGAGWWFLQKRTLSERQDTVANKSVEAQRLESIIKEVEEYQKRKDSLQKRIDLINNLKQSQKGPVRIMDQISKDLPDLVWLDKLSMSGGLISIEGRGLNPNAIANFVENIKSDSFFEEPDLSSMTGASVSGKTPVYTFVMSFKFTYAPKGEAGAADAATGTAGTGGSASTSGTGGK